MSTDRQRDPADRRRLGPMRDDDPALDLEQQWPGLGRWLNDRPAPAPGEYGSRDTEESGEPDR